MIKNPENKKHDIEKLSNEQHSMMFTTLPNVKREGPGSFVNINLGLLIVTVIVLVLYFLRT